MMEFRCRITNFENSERDREVFITATSKEEAWELAEEQCEEGDTVFFVSKEIE